MKNFLMVLGITTFLNLYPQVFASTNPLKQSLQDLYKTEQAETLKSQYSNPERISNELKHLGFNEYEVDFFSEQIIKKTSKLPATSFSFYERFPFQSFIETQMTGVVHRIQLLPRDQIRDFLWTLLTVSKRMDVKSCANFYRSPNILNMNFPLLYRFMTKDERELIFKLLKHASSEKFNHPPKSHGSGILIYQSMATEKEESDRIKSETEKCYTQSLQKRLNAIKPERKRIILQALLGSQTVSVEDYCHANIFNLETILMNEAEFTNQLVLRQLIKDSVCHMQ